MGRGESMNQFGWFQNNEQLPPGNAFSNKLKTKVARTSYSILTLKNSDANSI
jgi:hypothetical protein